MAKEELEAATEETEACEASEFRALLAVAKAGLMLAAISRRYSYSCASRFNFRLKTIDESRKLGQHC